MTKTGKTIASVLLCLFLISLVSTVMPVSASVSSQNSWEELAPMNLARAWLGAASVNGKIYAIGGSTASGFQPASFPYGIITVDHFVGTNEEYDPANNTWSYKAPMPTPRMCFAIAAVEGKIYCIGGRSIAGDKSGGYTSANEMYNPVTNSWENKAPMPAANGWIRAKAIDDKIYIMDIVNYGVLPASYNVYDPTSDTWNRSVPSTPAEKLLLNNIPDGYETTGIMSTKMVYTFSPSVLAYNPQNKSWIDGAGNPSVRSGFSVALADDIFYVVGGYTYEPWGPFAPLAANEKYVPFGYGTADPSYVLEHTPPQVSFESPLNQTYSNSSVSITFNVNKNITKASYSLDGQLNETVFGNFTIRDISSGLHNLTVYATDEYGNVGSQTVAITIAEPFPTFVVVSAVVIIVGTSIGLLLYRRYQKIAHSGI